MAAVSGGSYEVGGGDDRYLAVSRPRLPSGKLQVGSGLAAPTISNHTHAM